MIAGLILAGLQFKLGWPFDESWYGYALAGATVPLAFIFNMFPRATNKTIFWTIFLMCLALVLGYCVRCIHVAAWIDENINRMIAIVLFCVLSFFVMIFTGSYRKGSNVVFGLCMAPVLFFTGLILLKFFEVFGENLGCGGHIFNIVLWGFLAFFAYSWRYGYIPVPEHEYYCSNCGYYFGNDPRTCPRCGMNRLTTIDPGIGDTVKSR